MRKTVDASSLVEEIQREMDLYFHVRVPLPAPVVCEREIYRSYALLSEAHSVAATIRQVTEGTYRYEVKAGERETAYALYRATTVPEGERHLAHAAVWVAAVVHDLERAAPNRSVLRWSRGFSDAVLWPTQSAIHKSGFRPPWHHASTALPIPCPLDFFEPGEIDPCFRGEFDPTVLVRLAAMCAVFCNARYTPVVFVPTGRTRHQEREA